MTCGCPTTAARRSRSGISGGEIHGDFHALWINPNNPDHLISGGDGGLGISYDRGRTNRAVLNLPLAQFYHVAVDNELPYNVYGGHAGQRLVARAELVVDLRRHPQLPVAGGGRRRRLRDPPRPAGRPGRLLHGPGRATSAATTCAPTSCATSGRRRRTGSSCASTGTPAWPPIPSPRARSTTAASSSTSRPTAARAGRSSART